MRHGPRDFTARSAAVKLWVIRSFLGAACIQRESTLVAPNRCSKEEFRIRRGECGRGLKVDYSVGVKCDEKSADYVVSGPYDTTCGRARTTAFESRESRAKKRGNADRCWG